jgi:hypothetical protein
LNFAQKIGNINKTQEAEQYRLIEKEVGLCPIFNIQ